MLDIKLITRRQKWDICLFDLHESNTNVRLMYDQFFSKYNEQRNTKHIKENVNKMKTEKLRE